MDAVRSWRATTAQWSPNYKGPQEEITEDRTLAQELPAITRRGPVEGPWPRVRQIGASTRCVAGLPRVPHRYSDASGRPVASRLSARPPGRWGYPATGRRGGRPGRASRPP